MGMTLSELRTRVRANHASRSDKNTDIDEFINEALRALAQAHTWKDLVVEYSTTLTADVYRYAFPTDMKECFAMRLIDGTDSRFLTEKTKRWYMEYEPYPSGQTTARPSVYAVDGNYFEVYPVPDDAYVIYLLYAKWPATLTEDSDEPAIDDADSAIIAHATADLYFLQALYEDGREWERRYEKAMREAVRQDNKRPGWRPQIGDTGAGGRGLPADYWDRPDIGLRW